MSIRPRADLDRVVEFLNQVFQADPQGMRELMERRAAFQGGTLERVPGLQGYRIEEAVGSKDLVGFLGVLNGIFGANDQGEGPFAAWYEPDADGKPVLTGFSVVRRQG